MPHRMDIELTSARGDESFTWRAAGAREPKGVVESSLLPKGSKIGDVVRVEAEIELDGISIISVLPSKQKSPVKGLIEVIGTPQASPGVTTTLAGGGRGGRSRRGELDFEPDRERRNGDRRPRRSASEEGGRPAERPVRGERRPSGEHSGEHRSAERRPPGERRPSPERRPSGDRGVASERRPGTRGAGGEHERGERSERRPREHSRTERGGQRLPAAEGAPESGTTHRRGPVRLEPGTKHRDELFESLSAEQRPIAERLASGGLPALRKAIAEEQQRAKTEGRPIVSGEPLIAIAEQLMPSVQGAIWLDRAEAAAERMEEITLRDLRTAVAGAAPRDEKARELQKQLREGLEKRVTKLRTEWEGHIRQAVDDGRVLQALRLSGRPPEPTAKFPAALVEPLAAHASEAMTADTAPDRWLALLEAAVASPVRRQVKPSGIPKDETGDVEHQARLAAGRVPALAALLGMAMPPPPRPIAGERVPHRTPRASRPTATRNPSRTAKAPAAPMASPVETRTPVETEGAEPAEPADAAMPAEPAVAAVPAETDEPTELVEPTTPAEAPVVAEADEPAELVEPAAASSGEPMLDEPVEQSSDEV